MQHLECAAVKVGCDLGLFKLLVEAGAQDPTCMSVGELADKTGAEPEFLG